MPLRDVRILELGHTVAVPFTTMLLSGFGEGPTAMDPNLSDSPIQA